MISINTVSQDLAESYKKEDAEVRLRRYNIACLLALIGTASGVTLDYIVYPEKIWALFFTRLGAIGFVSAIYFVAKLNAGKSRIVFLNLLWALSMNLSICVMVYVTGGASSPYYAGLNLVILAAGVLLPWTLMETLSVSIISLGMYIVACVLSGTFFDENVGWSLLFNNCFFIFLTGLISTTSSHFTSQAKIKDFNLRHELDSRNKQLEDMDRMKSQFFANVSHELRTPLTLILSPIQDLLRKPELLSDSVSKSLRTARDNSLRLLKLVNDLLEVIKLEEGKTKLHLQSVDLNSFMRSIVDSMSHMAQPNNIELHKQLPAEPLIINADSYALERIALNLLSNAIKFTPPGGSITVKTTKNAQSAKIEIIDTGIGISKADLPRIFDRFQQADGSTTRRYQGSGLGLALVKDLLEKMGGNIAVKSEPDAGTVMTVTLPISKIEIVGDEVVAPAPRENFLDSIHQSAEHRAALPINSPFEKLESKFPAGKGPKLMIVDDEPDMREYLASILDQEYRVAQVRNGKHALELARETKPDLMLLDLMMPELDGHEVCKLLKSDAQTRQIKIVLLTARIDEAAKITALENGADDFLTKPFSRVEVETRLRNLLETSRLEATLVDKNHDLESTLQTLKQTQSQLVQSEKLNALGSLAAGLLHEVNNPLNYVITAIQLAMMEPEAIDNDDLKEYLADINEGVDRIRNIVSDLHTFAHPSEVDKRKSFSLKATVKSSLRFTADFSKGVNITEELHGPDTVFGSQSHIVQVLVNLINNATKAIRETNEDRSGVITIRSEEKNNKIRISVSDNGIGMNEEIRKKVFDPFFTTKDVGEGMGLGLSVCHTIIANHGGTLEVTSQEGKGSEFSFDLPLNNSQDFQNDENSPLKTLIPNFNN